MSRSSLSWGFWGAAGSLGLLVACSGTTVETKASADGGGTVVPTPDGGTLPGVDAGPPIVNRSLGMNDVSILVPLPKTDQPVLLRASDKVSDGNPALPSDLVAKVTTISGRPDEFGDIYDKLQITAVRLDVCDRNTSEPCNPSEDGRLRIVYQPFMKAQTFDTGIHAFYSIPRADLPKLVAEFRALAEMQGEPITSPLKLNPALSREAEGGAYHVKLRAMLSAYLVSSKLVRVTGMTQSQLAAALRWVFHGIERDANGEWNEIQIPGVSSTTQDVLLLSQASYQVTPVADSPKGVSIAFSKEGFAKASPADREAALRSVVEIDNPTKASASSVQCVSCHVSTVVLSTRAKEFALDPKAVAGRFQAPYDLSAAAESIEDDQLLRGFGWRTTAFGISQRVVNETALVLSDIEKQFPTGK